MIQKKYILILLFQSFFLVFPAFLIGYENWFEKGIASLHAKKYDEAISFFSLTIETVPNDYEAFNNRGIAWSYKGEYDKALDDYTKAIELNNTYHLAFLNRGIVWRKKGDIVRAFVDYGRALELNAQYVQTYKNVSWVLSTCPEKIYRNGDLSVKLIKKAITINPKAVMNDALAAAYAETGNFAKAVTNQKRYIEIITDAGITNEISLNKERLRLYENNEPLREKYFVITPVNKRDALNAMMAVKKAVGIKSRMVKVNPLQVIGGKLGESGKLGEKRYPYAIQISSFREKKTAGDLVKRLEIDGYQAFTNRVLIPDKGQWYRVFIGYYESFKAAEKALSGHIVLKFPNAYVVKKPYSIQIINQKRDENIKGIKKKLEMKGYFPYLVQANQTVIPRLLIGAFDSREDAENFTRSLALEEYNVQVVKR